MPRPELIDKDASAKNRSWYEHSGGEWLPVKDMKIAVVWGSWTPLALYSEFIFLLLKIKSVNNNSINHDQLIILKTLNDRNDFAAFDDVKAVTWKNQLF